MSEQGEPTVCPCCGLFHVWFLSEPNRCIQALGDALRISEIEIKALRAELAGVKLDQVEQSSRGTRADDTYSLTIQEILTDLETLKEAFPKMTQNQLAQTQLLQVIIDQFTIHMKDHNSSVPRSKRGPSASNRKKRRAALEPHGLISTDK